MLPSVVGQGPRERLTISIPHAVVFDDDKPTTLIKTMQVWPPEDMVVTRQTTIWKVKTPLGTFALKTISKHDTKDLRACEKAANELRLLRALRGHPHVVTVEAGFQTPHDLCLLLEWCPKDFMTVLEDGCEAGFLWSQMMSWMGQLADVFQALRVHDLIHRDVKPENIFVAADGTLRLGDFEFAITSTTLHQTGAHAMVGTIVYMAPEMIHGDIYDFPIDMWALGIVFYDMLTGFYPFAALHTPKNWTSRKACQACLPAPQRGVVAPYPKGFLRTCAWWPAHEEEAVAMLDGLLALHPDDRWDAARVADAVSKAQCV